MTSQSSLSARAHRNRTMPATGKIRCSQDSQCTQKHKECRCHLFVRGKGLDLEPHEGWRAAGLIADLEIDNLEAKCFCVIPTRVDP